MTDNNADAAAQDSTDAGATDTSAEDSSTILGGENTDDTAADDTKADESATTDNDDGNDGKATDNDGKETDKDEGKDDDKSDPEPFDVSKVEMPEGFKVNDALMGKLGEFAKENKLSQEKGQALVAMATELSQSIADSYADQHAETVKNWAAEVKADKEIGGDKFADTQATVDKVMKAFGTPELQKTLNDSGYGNHPGLVRMIAKIGKALSEDSFSVEDAGTGKKSGLEAIYNHPTSQQQS